MYFDVVDSRSIQIYIDNKNLEVFKYTSMLLILEVF